MLPARLTWLRGDILSAEEAFSNSDKVFFMASPPRFV